LTRAQIYARSSVQGFELTYFRQLVVGKIGESVQTQWDEHGSSGSREAPSG
jgi:hypothetical protein